MARNKKNSVLAILMIVMMIMIMPATTQEAYASKFKEADFTQHIKGLKDGKIVTGTTITVDVGAAMNANEEMMESFFEYGRVEVMLHTFAPADMVYFDYDSDSMIAKLKVTEKMVNIGTHVEVLINFGDTSDDVYYIPHIDVVDKYANPLDVKGMTAKVKYSKLKKKTQYLAVEKVINFINKGQGTKTYSLSSAKKGSKSYKKYFKVNSSTGKITVKKRLKKGTYTLKVKVKANGNDYYKASETKTVTIKVKVG